VDSTVVRGTGLGGADIIYNTMSAEMAAWHWYIVEKQASAIADLSP